MLILCCFHVLSICSKLKRFIKNIHGHLPFLQGRELRAPLDVRNNNSWGKNVSFVEVIICRLCGTGTPLPSPPRSPLPPLSDPYPSPLSACCTPCCLHDAVVCVMAFAYSATFTSAVFSAPFIIAIFFVIAIKIALSSDWYKKIFAQGEARFAQITKEIFAPLKQKVFVDLGERLKEVNGDILEIGIGAGENLYYYPQGSSIIAVDPNVHVEKLLRENLEKAGDKVHLKKFLATSAEDLSCKPGKFGVEDNSVAVVVCTLVLCSLTDDQTKKTLQEVKRVLKPVSMYGLSLSLCKLCAYLFKTSTSPKIS